MPSIAVVIPVKNGFPEITFCIEGILKQSVRVDRILAIDSGSTDGTIEYLKTISEVELIHINPGDFNHGETRNLGWLHCNEDFLFYTVQDARPVNNSLLQDLLDGFLDPEVAAVCGQQIVPHDKKINPVDWFRPVSGPELIRFQFKDPDEFVALDPNRKRNICAWDNVAAMYRSAALRKIPFQRTVFGEDMIWAREAILEGHAIVYNQHARVYHYHLENREVIFKRYFTSMYFRFKQFNYIPGLPGITLRNKLSMVKILVQAYGLNLKNIFYWYQYTIDNSKAVLKAHLQFLHSLEEGEAALDRKHQELCGTPPIPIKAG